VGYGLFDKEAAHFVMEPFFRDHTSYGAILAILFFALGGIILNYKAGLLKKVLLWASWILTAIALILSYTRAAWISVLFAMGILGLTLLRIRFRYILVISVLAVLYFTSQRITIIQKMEKNRQTSSVTLSEHVQSISNITTDESNLERINRWNCALKMFAKRPVFGWGPGTYMFQYAPFQLSYEKTGISTDFGDRGNAHSEYIGPLAESGLLGSVSFMLIGFLSLLTGFRVYNKTGDRRLKQITLGLMLGFISYLVHGTLNNFLDTDKASALFWGIAAAFVSLDLSSEKLNPQD
jgi:O-antigen ligase